MEQHNSRLSRVLDAGAVRSLLQDLWAGAAGGRSYGQYFGTMQTPGKARLILIRGTRASTAQLHVAGTEHIAGREDGQSSSRGWLAQPASRELHLRKWPARVRDEGSLNGVYVRVREGVPLSAR
jgi:hypothetical protein